MQFLRNLGVRFSEARRRYKAYGELMQLDSRTLADIGLARSQIEAAVFGSEQQTRKLPARLVSAPSLPETANGNRARNAA